MADTSNKRAASANLETAVGAANVNNTTSATSGTNAANTTANIPAANTSGNTQAQVPGKVPENQQEPGLDYTVNHGLDANLQPSTKATANYLIHRMLWDQQDKLDNDDVAVSKQGTMEVQDDFDVQPRK